MTGIVKYGQERDADPLLDASPAEPTLASGLSGPWYRARRSSSDRPAENDGYWILVNRRHIREPFYIPAK
jgi:hypothetical protein